MRFILKISSIIVIPLIFLACASTPQIVVQEVKIPQKCRAYVPERPDRIELISQNIVKILEYTEKLEALVNMCVENESTPQQTDNLNN